MTSAKPRGMGWSESGWGKSPQVEAAPNGRLKSESMSSSSKLPYYVAFFVAGIPALIYQVTWQRVLALYFGVDIYSTSVTVSTFMLGLGVGSLGGGVIADRARRPDVIYAACEAALAVCGALSLPMFRLVGEALAGAALPQMVLAVSGLLLVPTLLMGMTLPLMVRTLLVRDASSLGRSVAWLYGANTLGAACGALLTAYFVIGAIGLYNATLLAAGINVLLALVILWLGRGITIATPPVVAAPPESRAASHDSSVSASRVLVLSFLSGAVALGYEIVWYRLLKLLLHGTAYVFGTILGVLLFGMGLGSLLARRRIDEPAPLRRFGNAQLVMAGYVCLSLGLLGHGGNLPGIKHLIAASSFISFHPAPELAQGDFSAVSLYSLFDTFFWPALMMGVPAVAMGYGFPNLVRAAPEARERAGKSLGALYCANIAGATLGSLAVGFVLLELLGSERILVVLSALCITSAALAGALASEPRRRWLSAAALVVVSLAILPRRGELIRSLHLARSPSVEFLAREDKTGIVVLRRQLAVVAFAEEKSILGEQRLYIDGARHGGLSDDGADIFDKGLKVSLAAHSAPRRVLSIGLGDGKMVATAVSDPAVQEVVVIELSSGLRDVLGRTSQGALIEASPKLRYENDDGRRWLLAHPNEKFDMIMAWPLHAAHAFSGSLYSAEFFAIVQRHLAPGGIFFTRTADAFSTAHTLASVFPHVVRIKGSAYAASEEPLAFSAGRAQQTEAELLANLEADRAAILAHAGGAPVARDFWPRSEYYLSYPWAWVLGRHGGDHGKLYTSPEPDLKRLVVP